MFVFFIFMSVHNLIELSVHNKFADGLVSGSSFQSNPMYFTLLPVCFLGMV